MTTMTSPLASGNLVASKRPIQVGWFDCDANRHMKNTSYIEHAINNRFLVWSEHGFPASGFDEHRIGPVVVREEVVYRRELHLLQSFSVQSLCAGTNASGTRNLFVNRIFDADGELAAELRSMVIWLDLDARKARVPPLALTAAIQAMAKTDDYAPL